MNGKLKGVMGAPITPFTEENKVDFDSFSKQINFLIENGIKMISHPMHIGESINLNEKEQKDLVNCLVEAAGNRVPVFVNVSKAGTDLARELALYSQNSGASGVILLPPYHWKPTQQGLYDHFVSVVGDLDIDFIAYNNPKNVQVEIGIELIKRLIDKLPNFIGLKDASFHMGFFTEACRVTRDLNPNFSIFTGVEYLLTSMPVGGCGCYSACSEVAPKLVNQLFDACENLNISEARELQYKVKQLLELLNENHLRYPVGIKYAMECLQRPVGHTRKPIMPLNDEEKKDIEDLLEKLDIYNTEQIGW
jgi:4-hydroxy-tetrahydrodipicolinate synthase